jgi:hypothetical protein
MIENKVRSRRFTIEDVRRINDDMISGKARDYSKLSPVSQRILRSASFTAEDINRAFAEAREMLRSGK